ncbi:hypothetical protein AB0M54_13595 [Actinoplanes sp. NPDC051470]|uniref:hypothetical protein n=1 Tax=Actinoplanes sp. NPDC051470 TaxID=3157224 RepID=UPI0034499D3B
MTKRLRIIVVAMLVMLAGAWVGAFAGSRLAWEFAPDLPSGAAAGRLKETAFPGLQVYGGGNAKIIEPYGDGEGIRYGSVGYWVKHTTATQDVAAYSAGVRQRLTAAGWTVHDYDVATPEALVDGGNAYDATFWATRPGLVLSFSDHFWTGRPAYDSTGAAAFDLWRQEPSWMPAAAWGGAIGGAAIVLLLTMWVYRRARPAARGPLTVGALVSVALMLPSTLTPGQETPMDGPWWGGFYYFGLGPAVLAAIICGAILLYALTREPAVRATVRFLARRPRVVGAVALVALLAAVLPWGLRMAGVPPCEPSGLPAEARDSTHVKIFVSNTSTPQERALIDAAIFRSRAGSLGELVWEPSSSGFRETYCGGGPVPDEAVATLPYYFDVDLSNTATFPALTDEVAGLAGVVAVRRTAD